MRSSELLSLRPSDTSLIASQVRNDDDARLLRRLLYFLMDRKITFRLTCGPMAKQPWQALCPKPGYKFVLCGYHYVTKASE